MRPRSRILALVIGLALFLVVILRYSADLAVPSQQADIPEKDLQQPSLTHTNRAETDWAGTTPPVGPVPAQTEPRLGPEDSVTDLEVVVLDKDNNQPIVGARVQISTQATLLSEETTPHTGRVLFKLPLGDYTLETIKDGFHSLETAWNVALAGGPRSKEVRLARHAVLSGRVIDQFGDPVADASVLFSDRRRGYPFQTEADGTFEATLYRGRFDLTVYKPPHPRVTREQFEVGLEGNWIEVTIHRLRQLVKISGRVIDQDGRPVVGALVRLKSESEGTRDFFVQSQTGEDGRFALESPALPKATLSAQEAGFQIVEKTLALEADQQVDFQLTAYPSFQVRIYDWMGREILNPFPGVFLSGHAADDSAKRVLVRLDSGRYCATQYPFYLQAQELKGQVGIIPPTLIPQYQPEIVLKALKGAELKGFVTDLAGSPVKKFGVNLSLPDGAHAATFIESEDGYFSFPNVPTGKATLVAMAEGIGFSRTEILIAENPTVVDLLLRPFPKRP